MNTPQVRRITEDVISLVIEDREAHSTVKYSDEQRASLIDKHSGKANVQDLIEDMSKIELSHELDKRLAYARSVLRF